MTGYLMGGAILLGLTWLVLVPAAVVSGRRRRSRCRSTES
jgi:hypothetical protein